MAPPSSPLYRSRYVRMFGSGPIAGIMQMRSREVTGAAFWAAARAALGPSNATPNQYAQVHAQVEVLPSLCSLNFIQSHSPFVPLVKMVFRIFGGFSIENLILASALMERRWSFLHSWCHVLQYRIHYRGLQDDDGDVWNSQQRTLQVILPTRTGVYGEYKDEATFQMEFQSTREALALLAAVAHVDFDGWKFLLANQCGVDFGANGETAVFDADIPVRFVLLMEHQAELDLVQLCGVTQRRLVSAEYLKMLEKIASMDRNWRPERPGLDLEIPVRVIFSSSTVYKADAGPIQILASIQNAERMIRDEWESYNWSLENQPVEPGQLRCTFTLEPMIGDICGLGCCPEIAEVMAKFVGENVRFSQLSISADMDQQRERRATPMSFRQMMAVIFDATRRSQELANTKYCSKMAVYTQEAVPLQMGTVFMQCNYTLGPAEYEAIFSAIVINQATRKLTIRLRLDSKDTTNLKEWWKWLAYGCFSERARKCSALESLVLTDIDNVNILDLADFSAVLASEHTEETLYGSDRGQVEEKDALLKKGALVQWLFSKEGQPRYNSIPVKFSAAVPYVRTFSDDGKSELVNVLIPGFGRCIVQRADLVVHQSQLEDARERGLTSLTLKFSNRAQPSSRGGLPRLLSASGSSLRFLTIDGPGEEVDENLILQNCPHLEEFSLRKGWVGVRLNFSDFHARNEPIPKLQFRWQDIEGLTRDLRDKQNSFTRCLRQLSIRLTNLEGFGYSQWVRYEPAINLYLEALLEMLEVNQTLEYLEIIVPSECHNYGGYFKSHHLKPINRGRKLSRRSKAAFISALSSKVSATSLKLGKAMKCEGNLSRSISCDLDPRVVSSIFSYATFPVLRQVFFREKFNDVPSEIC